VGFRPWTNHLSRSTSSSSRAGFCPGRGKPTGLAATLDEEPLESGKGHQGACFCLLCEKRIFRPRLGGLLPLPGALPRVFPSRALREGRIQASAFPNCVSGQRPCPRTAGLGPATAARSFVPGSPKAGLGGASPPFRRRPRFKLDDYRGRGLTFQPSGAARGGGSRGQYVSDVSRRGWNCDPGVFSALWTVANHFQVLAARPTPHFSGSNGLLLRLILYRNTTWDSPWLSCLNQIPVKDRLAHCMLGRTTPSTLLTVHESNGKYRRATTFCLGRLVLPPRGGIVCG